MQNMNATGLRLGDVEVLEMDPSTNRLALGIKVNCKPNELMLLSAKVETSEKLQATFRYLVAEGFIRPMSITRWHINVFAAAKL